MYHTQFVLATINVHVQPNACRVLQLINESSGGASIRPTMMSNTTNNNNDNNNTHNHPNNNNANNVMDEWLTLPKLMAIDLRAQPMRATFCRTHELRCKATSDWLELLVRNRLNSQSGSWFNFTDDMLEE